MVSLLEKRKKRTGGVLTLFALATFGLHLFALFLLISQGLAIRTLSLQKSPTFEQLIDGKPVTLRDDLEREPQAIRQFVSQTMTSMFNWSGTLPAQSIEQATNPIPDRGISVQTSTGSGKKVATSSWIASFGISEDFRKGFLSTVAQMTPSEVFSNNPNQAISGQLIIKRVYPPVRIAQGKWRVGIVADLVQKKRFQQDKKLIVPFNKDILVSAVDTFVYPLSDITTDLQKAVYSVRSAKMEIDEIRNLCLLDEYGKPTENNFNPCENPGNSGSFIK